MAWSTLRLIDLRHARTESASNGHKDHAVMSQLCDSSQSGIHTAWQDQTIHTCLQITERSDERHCSTETLTKTLKTDPMELTLWFPDLLETQGWQRFPQACQRAIVSSTTPQWHQRRPWTGRPSYQNKSENQIETHQLPVSLNTGWHFRLGHFLWQCLWYLRVAKSSLLAS